MVCFSSPTFLIIYCIPFGLKIVRVLFPSIHTLLLRMNLRICFRWCFAYLDRQIAKALVALLSGGAFVGFSFLFPLPSCYQCVMTKRTFKTLFWSYKHLTSRTKEIKVISPLFSHTSKYSLLKTLMPLFSRFFSMFALIKPVPHEPK